MGCNDELKSLNKEVDAEYLQSVDLATRIYKKYGDFIYAIIRYNVNRGSDVDDIFQEFFLSLINRPIPKNIENVKSYIYRAIKNDILDAVQREKSYRMRIFKHAQYHKAGYNNSNPLNIVIKNEQIEKIFSIIEEHIPRHEGQAIVHRHYYGKDTGEVAVEMRISKRSLSKYLCTGLKKLKKLIKEHCDDHDTT